MLQFYFNGSLMQMDSKDIQIRNLYEALKAAEYYIERLEAFAGGKRVRDMTEAMEHYHRIAPAVIDAFDKEFS